MIYGLNFNGTQIPPGYKRRFAQTLKRSGVLEADLKGVATSLEEAEQMKLQADNGHRMVFIERRKTAGADVFGVYVA